MTKLQIMNEIAYIENDPLLTFSACRWFAHKYKKSDLFKVLNCYRKHDPEKIFFFDICCYWLDDNYNRHYIVCYCPNFSGEIEEVY